ncbi:hypothetical protein KIN20_011628 [Parelaphostrongylus tenuis]|uniref:UBX domain-containing protein n=1 Tax=Parelaphostrongylus tenuis TaxID=148309 RepID=A0AAD5MB52_PARTN|nr:hypothetical protein KIN20_011628 [Parelaphostrongylus tenuis]
MVSIENNINNFKEFCGITEDRLAIRYLDRCNGDLQAAIQLYFQTDGMLEDVIDDDWSNEALHGSDDSDDEPRIRRNSEDRRALVAQTTEFSSRHTSVVQPWRQYIFAIITLPFNFFISTIYDVLGFFYELVVGERAPAEDDIREDVSNFRRAVDERFMTSVEFFDGTIEEAFIEACLAEKVFAVFMFTPGEQYTDETSAPNFGRR